jgi:hypothetical protein
MPGGKVDWGERIRATAEREVREETGLEIAETSWKLLETFNCLAPRYHSVEFTLAAKLPPNQTPQNPEPDTHEEWAFYSLEELRTKDLFEPLRERINRKGVITRITWDNIDTLDTLELEWDAFTPDLPSVAEPTPERPEVAEPELQKKAKTETTES